MIQHEADVLIIHHRHEGHGSSMDDHFAVGRRSIAEPDRLERQSDLQPPVNQAPRWL